MVRCWSRDHVLFLYYSARIHRSVTRSVQGTRESLELVLQSVLRSMGYYRMERSFWRYYMGSCHRYFSCYKSKHNQTEVFTYSFLPKINALLVFSNKNGYLPANYYSWGTIQKHAVCMHGGKTEIWWTNRFSLFNSLFYNKREKSILRKYFDSILLNVSFDFKAFNLQHDLTVKQT